MRHVIGNYVSPAAASSTHPSPQSSPSCAASPSGSSPASSDTSAVASSTIGAAAIIRCSRAASSASVMSDNRFVIASAERCRSRDCAGRPYPRSKSAVAAAKRVESVWLSFVVRPRCRRLNQKTSGLLSLCCRQSDGLHRLYQEQIPEGLSADQQDFHCDL